MVLHRGIVSVWQGYVMAPPWVPEMTIHAGALSLSDSILQLYFTNELHDSITIVAGTHGGAITYPCHTETMPLCNTMHLYI